ncbi:MAG: carbohydrate binding domain-containing protein [Chlorobia bacterium]|nr:carbohydrate binding domain-containing protein [Fimbriimonadaceae bacterium]
MILTSIVTLLLGAHGQTPTVNWTINADRPGHIVSPSLYGVFFEEINCAGDGGIYAELVRNRGFEDAEKADHWKVSEGKATLDRTNPLSSASPTSIKVESNGKAVLENEGYWGMAIKNGETYELSFHSWGEGGKLAVQLVAQSGTILGQTNLTLPTGNWKQTKTTIKAFNGGDAAAKLVFRFMSIGTNNLDMVSLFPKATWKNRANGLRKDLVQMLDDMKPAFVRFPGGCWIEGETMALALRWKQTVGNLQDRRTQPNLWRYMSTNGLGYHEYLQMCEDIKSDALFVINCGMSHREVVPMDKMDEYVQDALDAVEYAIGPVDSTWGALRAKNGHPKPFPLKYLQIGNENGGPNYDARYGLMYRAIKQKYPQVNLIANLWGGRPQSTPVDILDEHYYSNPEFFVSNADRYDNYDRKRPKIYVGEYAVTQGNGVGSLKGALAEAAFMAGMERNSDIVTMSSYAPLFANVNNKAWNPDLIYFDSHRVVATPSYHVQKLFFTNRAHQAIPSQFSNVPTTKRSFPAGGFGIGTWNTKADFKDIKVTQGDKVLFESKDGAGLTNELGSWEAKDGAYSQTGDATPARAFAGSDDWKNYTVELKARKVSGAEGFMVTVGRRGRGDYVWWNLGGWGNTQHGVEVAMGGGKSILAQRNGRIESGRWYSLKLEYTEDRMKGYIDGQLALNQQLVEPKSLHGVSGFDKGRQTAILKLVNVSDQPYDVEIDLTSTGWKDVVGAIDTLSGQNTDENSLDSPKIVAPKQGFLLRKPAKFIYRIEPRTLAILKVKKA